MPGRHHIGHIAFLPLLLCFGMAAHADPGVGGSNDSVQQAGAALVTQLGEDARNKISPLPQPVHMTLCIFDLSGEGGYIANLVHQVAEDARAWNLLLDIKVYTSERVEAEDFKAGQCDGAVLSTLRAREFNHIIGSIDAPGNLPDYASVKRLLQTLAKPALAAFSTSGHYQVAAVIPVGAIYPVVNDRRLDSVEKLAGKRIVVMDWDKSQSQMVSSLGAQPVPADLSTFGSRFNNGDADVITVPVTALQPLELYKGMGTRGGVVRFPLFQATATLLIRRETMLARIPDLDVRLGQIRQFGLAHLDQLLKFFSDAEAAVPAKLWIDLAPAAREKYQRMLRDARLHMTQTGVYDPTMMHILKRVRCQQDPGRAECSQMDE